MRTLIVNARVDEEDTPHLTRGQARLAVRAMRRLAELPDPSSDPDVAPLEKLPGAWRWKPSSAIRNLPDCDIRVVFRFSDSQIEILAVRSRDDVYQAIGCEQAYRPRRR